MYLWRLTVLLKLGLDVKYRVLLLNIYNCIIMLMNDMKVNIKKTKVMNVSRKGEGELNITIDGERLEQVDRFRYLGSLNTSDGRCETKIKTRISMDKNVFNQRKLLSKV